MTDAECDRKSRKAGRGSLLRKAWKEICRPFTAAAQERRAWRREMKAVDRLVNDRGLHVPAEASQLLTDRVIIPELAGLSGRVVVIIDDRFPEPDRDSGSLDAVNMISCFKSLGYHVVFASVSARIQDSRYADATTAMGAIAFLNRPGRSIHRLIATCGHQVDLFVMNRVGAGGAFLERIRRSCPDAKIIFNTVDLHHIREERAARLAGNEQAIAAAAMTRLRELELIRQSDLTFLVSDVEEAMIQQALPACSTALLPLARPISEPSTTLSSRNGIGFVGGFDHAPNIDALRHFLRDVWPLLRQSDPEIRFSIVGSGLALSELDGVAGNVQYLGPLPSIEEWLSGLRMTVAPLRIGAGAKGKVASSLANGVPCVVSPIAAEGMGLVDGRDVLIGYSAEQMASHILRLQEDDALWQCLSRNSLDFASRNISRDAFGRALNEALERIGL